MLIEEIQRQIRVAMKDGDTVAKEVLRVALGEVQTIEARTTKPATDEEVAAVVRKLVKSNEETIAASAEGPARDTLQRENDVLRALLPKNLDVAGIVAALAGQIEPIKAAKGDGQAMGVAMKALKAQGLAVDAKDVGEAVKQLRA